MASVEMYFVKSNTHFHSYKYILNIFLKFKYECGNENI